MKVLLSLFVYIFLTLVLHIQYTYRPPYKLQHIIRESHWKAYFMCECAQNLYFQRKMSINTLIKIFFFSDIDIKVFFGLSQRHIYTQCQY